MEPVFQLDKCIQQKKFYATSNRTIHQAVVMTGNLVDCCEPGKLNEIGTWYKPWFFKHVQGFFETGSCQALISTFAKFSNVVVQGILLPLLVQQAQEQNTSLSASTTTGATNIINGKLKHLVLFNQILFKGTPVQYSGKSRTSSRSATMWSSGTSLAGWFHQR